MKDTAVIFLSRTAVSIVLLTASLTAAAVTRDVADTEGSGLADPLNLLDIKTDELETENVETEAVDTETTDQDLDDIVITANDPTNTIKEENIFKCQKCLKNQFRYRHDGFCGKCVLHDVIDVKEQEKLNSAIRCKKCQKMKFRSRNTLFCSVGCDTKVEEPKTTTTTEKMMDLEIDEEKDELRKKKEKKKAEREQRRKEKQQRKLEKKRKRFGYTTSFSEPTVGAVPAKDPNDPDVDVWGEILKALVIANTWQ